MTDDPAHFYGDGCDPPHEKPLRIIVCGGRDYYDRTYIASVLGDLPRDSVIVTGGARGVDSIAHEEAMRLGFVTEVHPADWNQHGRYAGFMRNQEMLDAGADVVIAFPGGTGTADMMRRASKAGVMVQGV